MSLRPGLLLCAILAAATVSLTFLATPSLASEGVIKSHEELVVYLRENSENNPLSSLSPAARNEFVGSLKFCNDGLSSLNYSVLVENLDLEDIYATLSLFGHQHALFAIPNMKERFLESRLAATVELTDAPLADWIPDHYCEINGICYYSPGAMCNYFSCKRQDPPADGNSTPRVAINTEIK